MNKNILIIGMGKSGQALARYLGKEGHQLYLYDRKTEHQEEICEKLDLDQSICGFYDDNSVADVLNKIDEAVISPGISLQSKIARLCTDHSIPLIGEIEMAYRQARGDFIAITGTNGKTTTANLVYELIKREKQDVFLAGNIGTPLIDIVPFTTKNSVIVLEISSFQLETIQSFRPKASVVLNITPDHLDRHKTMEEYVRAKKRIAENCGEGDFFVYNEDDPIVREFQDFACEKISFSLSHPVKKGAYYDGRALQLLDEHNREPIIEKTDLKIPGPHNIQNVLAAVCLCYFYGISKETIAEGIRTFAGVEHRLEFVDKVKGVSFVNDSKATNVEAAITGLKAMDTPVVLIGGGYDKGADYSPWIEAFSGKVRKLILFGETAEDIYKTAVKYGYRDITICENLEQATRMGYEQAQKGETVLLSPACASWDQYESYEHRGRAFKKLVKELK